MPIDPRTGQPLPYNAPPPAGPGLQQDQIPPEVAGLIDKNNPMQMELLRRIDKLTPQDGQALQAGISPQAAAALKKVIPEVGFMIDMIHAGTVADMMQDGEAQQQPQPRAAEVSAARRPTTTLGRF